MQVHLVDGTYELFRCFFGAPSRKGLDGVEVGAARALVGSLLTLLTDPDVTHVGVAFDTTVESFRNQLFDGYKTGAGIDPELFGQFPLVEQATRALGLVTWSMIEFECDDALATMAVRAAADPRVTQVRILSPDKDLCQVVDGARIVTVDRVRESTLDAEGVRAKFGVPPAAIPDYLALVGDAADGVPGVPGIGAKTAAALLVRWGRLEDIPLVGELDVPVRGAAKVQTALAAHADAMRLYKTLTTLRLGVPLPEGVDALRWRGPDEAEVATLAVAFGDDKLPARVAKAWQKHRALHMQDVGPAER